jgi:hypothetical protein
MAENLKTIEKSSWLAPKPLKSLGLKSQGRKSKHAQKKKMGGAKRELEILS